MTISTKTRVGFAGLGQMGARIAVHLTEDGYPVTVWNRTAATAEAWANANGAMVARSPAELAAANDLVITMLADGDALVEVWESPDGLLEGMAPGSVGIDMGTSGPVAFHRVRSAAAERDVVVVDAPVSGSLPAAESATLLIMVGGDEGTNATVIPILDHLGVPVPVGPAGSATVLKLAVNSVLYGLNQAVAEAVSLAEAAGVKPETTVDILTMGAAGAPLIGYRREQYLDPDSAPVMFSLDLACKDLYLARNRARESGLSTPQLERTVEIIDALIDRGYGSRDMGYAVQAQRDSNRPRSG
jgi:3-hydroxyisobutyrate dehydrogenase